MKKNPKDARGARKNGLWGVSPAAIAFMAHGAKVGNDKYGDFNYRKNDVKASVYIAAALRHILQYAVGEDIDPDPRSQGAPHLGLALSGLGVLADAHAHGNVVDDRAKSPAMAELFRDLAAVTRAAAPRRRARR